MSETSTIELSREQLTALRKAKSVGFYTTPTRSYIKTSRPGRKNGSEIDLDVPTESSVRGLRDANSPKHLRTIGFCNFRLDVDAGEIGMFWSTIAAFLKPGDRLKLSWGRDYETNGHMEDADLHGDRLTLLVYRTKPIPFAFIIGSEVSKDNTSRMIKLGRNNMESRT